MSGLEIAGVLLGAFPLLISSIEHWENVARFSHNFRHVKSVYKKCRRDIEYHELVYKRNLRVLLSPPIVSDADEIEQLIDDPGGDGWKDAGLQERLYKRLHEPYKTYMDIISQMQESIEGLKKELCVEEGALQAKLVPPGGQKQQSPSSPRLLKGMTTLDYQMFRFKFSFREARREEFFAQLKQCNEWLEKLLVGSDQMSNLRNLSTTGTKQVSAIETALSVAHKKSAALFRALEVGWNCTCLKFHFAHLRLEHRTIPETSWSWIETLCEQGIICASKPANSTTQVQLQPAAEAMQPANKPSTLPALPRTVDVARNVKPSVSAIAVGSRVNSQFDLCRALGERKCVECIGVVGHDSETYHLHPLTARRERDPRSSLTLDHILSPDHVDKLSRSQRYATALVLASSIAQLQSTPWLRTELNKSDVLFFPNADDGSINYNEPFIQQGFPSGEDTHADAVERNFFSLGILLLELCFGRRLEDEPLRIKQPVGDDAATKKAFDLMAALLWARGASDEGGLDYGVAVKWCFTPGCDLSKGWRTGLIKNVISPLEECQRQFKVIATI